MNAIEQDFVDLLGVIVREYNQRLGKINVNAVEILVLERIVLCIIDHMCQNADDLFTVFRLTDLVQFVYIYYRIQAFRVHQDIDDLTPCGIDICVSVTFKRGAVGRPTHRDE